MLVSIGAKPLADFTQPLEMLEDCHRRIEYFLDLLRKVEQRLGADELTDEGRRSLHSALNYFAEFAPRHTADEEQSLFPRLRRSDSAEARAVVADMERLEGDHRTCEEGHAAVDRLGRQWMASGRIDESQRAALKSTLAELADIYAAHIALEEQSVFQVAARTLASDEIREIGEEMKQRRSITTGDAPSATAGN
jgi:hemerythrin-like domain-containing protein